METLYVNLGSQSYPIHIGADLLTNLPAFLGSAESWVVMTDETVHGLYGQVLMESWNHSKVHTILLPQGEDAKSLTTVEAVLDRMLDLGVTRRSSILALGGGVVGDIAGFCASVYLRGIPYIQVPTTLLSQVDSSVGGKTGVNLSRGKNSVGSFYQPQGVFIDTTTLATLPQRQLISGIAEVIKYGVISDYAFLGFLETHFADLLQLEDEIMRHVISVCCQIKARIVAEDEKEQGVRKILNYGHTIGHALEIVTDYKEYTHGEAVLIGMHVEARMARELEMIDQEYCRQILSLIERTGITVDVKDLSIQDIIRSMEKDKKNRDGKVSFILPSNKGETTEVLLTQKEACSLLEML